ncbi:MAG: hypothetical protein ACLSX2_10170, partial [Christensenellaceae bacterium]
MGGLRAQDYRRIHAASGAAQGDQRAARLGQARIAGHGGHLHSHLDALAQHPQRMGHDLHREDAAIGAGQRALCPAERMGGRYHRHPAANQRLPYRLR